MFLVLVTNKQSNILEDLDTLRLLSKVVPEYCGVRSASLPRPRRTRADAAPPRKMVDEESVCRNAFELIFAFDEARARTRNHARSHAPS